MPALGKVPNYVNNSTSPCSTPRCDTMAAMLGVCSYALCAIPREDVPETPRRHCLLILDYRHRVQSKSFNTNRKGFYAAF